MDLKDRVALVAGGTGLLGTAIARALASAGAHIAITYLERHEAARETCAAVEALGRRAWSVTLDQTNAEAIPDAVEAAAKHFGRLDVLVNNAGWNISIPFPDLETLDAAVWDRLFSTNLRGPYLLARAAAARLKASGSGRIVNIASVAGLNPGGSSIAYATSKAGLIHLTRCLAVALAPEVSVNCVAPGLMDGTRMTSRLRPEVVQGALQRAVLRHAVSVEDVAAQVVAFCRSDSVTGQVLNIDAGVFFH
jgi:3-oxoacyl-[acyl-carrier protein] reductase